MKIRFNLTHPTDRRSGVRLIVSHRGKVYRKSVPDVTVSTKDWRVKSQRSGNPRVDARLKEIRLNLEGRLDDMSTEREVTLWIAKVLNGYTEQTSQPSDKPSEFWQYYEVWSNRPCHSYRDRRRAYNKVREIMGDRDDYCNIDRQWGKTLVERMDALGMSQNYQSSLIAKTRTCLKEAYDNGLTEYDGFRELKTKWVTADTTYLTKEEVDGLWSLDLTGRDAMARDLFIMGVFTAARFQNYSRLSLDDIKENGTIEFVQPKTMGRVILPVSPKVVTILERNGGSAPKMTQQEFNRRIKTICKEMGMTGTMDIVKTEGGKRVIERRERWTMVSSHTARRTGATLLYLSGVPMRQCMMLTGHVTEQNFMKYIKVTKEQNARLLADNPFFK